MAWRRRRRIETGPEVAPGIGAATETHDVPGPPGAPGAETAPGVASAGHDEHASAGHDGPEPAAATDTASPSRPATADSTDPAPPERWEVGPLRSSRDQDWRGIEATVAGHPLTFDLLARAPAERIEAILTALAPAALAAGATLHTDTPVERHWAGGVAAASGLMATWWDHSPTTPIRAPLSPEVDEPAAPPRDERVALCFTGGVDSFWSLFEGGHQPTHLLYVAGYDVPLRDRTRVAAQIATVEAVADAMGLETIVVRSDLRTHPKAGLADWERLHGAALAAAGMAASEHIDRLVIPPSYASDRLIPWGSRPDLDPLWSIPGVIAIDHSATPLPRLERVRAIAERPLVHQHLRVCWEHRSADANCGECEKCVRTMTQFAAAGHLPDLATMPTRDDLPARIRALAPLPEHHLVMWRDLLTEDLPGDVRSAIASITGATHDDS